MFQIVINFSSEEKKDFVQKFDIQLFCKMIVSCLEYS